jgi:hypothetical protein
MRKAKAIVAAGLLSVSLGAASASAAVIDLNQLQLTINSQPLNTYRVTVDGIPIIQTGQLTNLSAVAADVLARSTIQTGTKPNGTPFASLRLNQDVNVSVFQGLATTPMAQFTFGAGFSLNTDPQINNAISFLNNSNATQTYSVSIPLIFGAPITSPATKVKASFSGTLRDNQTSGSPNGVTIAPVGATIVTTSLLGSGNPSMSVDVGNAQTFAASALPDVYLSQFNPGPTSAQYKPGPVPAPSFIGMIQTTAFTLTARDRATMVAFSEIVPVPEPSSYALMAVGALVLAGLTRARRTQR